MTKPQDKKPSQSFEDELNALCRRWAVDERPALMIEALDRQVDKLEREGS